MCLICDEIKNNEFKLYEDEEIVVFLAKWGVKGLTIVTTKQHYTILEQVPEEVFGKCLFMANKVAGLVFQVLNCQGTNVLINNGDGANQEFAHFMIQVVPRFEGDNLALDWERKPADNEQLKDVAIKLQEQIKESEKKEELKQKQEEPRETKPETKSENTKDDRDNKNKSEKTNEEQENKEKSKKGKIPRWLIRIP
ncbi:MAG: histidine triad family protein [Candidatus Woesearchaeota archaeon]|nr:histidine triad family protein [Candidatus Woesearchaeota archaeon]MDN5327497.1 histidine triad family protein [Candidatus Woesearchaeota archaeon]